MLIRLFSGVRSNSGAMQKSLARAVEAGGTGQGHLPLPVPAGLK